MKRVILTLVAGLVLVTACSSKAKDHNAQDVRFAQDMVAHHQQAIEMSTMALAQAGSAKVKDLAGRIKAAQDPEIRTMKGWLSDWDAPETAGSDGMGGMDHGGGGGSMRGFKGSEWHTKPVSGTFLRAQDAISKASRTRLVRMLIDAFHPTIRRENTSVMNAT